MAKNLWTKRSPRCAPISRRCASSAGRRCRKRRIPIPGRPATAPPAKNCSSSSTRFSRSGKPMSDIRGPLSGIGVPVADAIAQYRALPPQRKSVAGVGFGAAVLAEWVYLGPDFDGGLLGISGALADEVWVGVALLPLVWLMLTLR